MIYYIKKAILLLFVFSALFSKTSVKGTILNIDNDEPLIGANVFIEETSQGDATDINGSYFIKDIESCAACQYTLKVLYIGFEE